MTEYVSKETVNGFTVKLHQDLDPESPRDWTHGADLVFSHRRYDFPNDAGHNVDELTAQELYNRLSDDGALLVLPVYMIDHSGLAFRVNRDFGDVDSGHWDSGLIGFGYVTEQNWADTQGTPWTGSPEDLEQARKLVESDVATYGQYVNGEVFGYTVEDFDGEVVDSCWGYYGMEYAESEARDAAEAATHQAKCTGSLNRLTGQVDHEGECPLHPAKLEELGLVHPETDTRPPAPEGAPAWNCVSYPGEGMHYLGSGKTCLWCGKTTEQIAPEYDEL